MSEHCVLPSTVVPTSYLDDAKWQVDFTHRSPQDIAPPTTKLIYTCMLKANATILEPYLNCTITIPVEYIGAINQQIKANSGRIVETEYSGINASVFANIPIRNYFNLGEQFMKAAEGRLSWRYDRGADVVLVPWSCKLVSCD
ncbi:MAG: hypothetical protein GY772_16700 [bacterium]|nr:hypothetical protein [bacterium]